MRRATVVLLAMLLLGEPERRVSRKAIAAELFPDEGEETAAANLRRHLNYLTVAGPALDLLVGRDRSSLWYRASEAVTCDVIDFEQGALEAYAGDFMDGFMHEWVVAQRERLRTLAVERFLRRAEALRDADDETGALASVRRAIEIDPWNEVAAHLEIELHGERGDLAALDAAYRNLERRLGDLDAKPSPETLALVQRFHERARTAAAGIPRPLTSYVQTRSFADVSALASAHRLVTISGPGGSGKTRLAVEVAQKVASSFPDGAHFVDLSAVSEADGLSNAVARAIGVPSNLASRGSAGIALMLRNRRALVVLDNCEQIAGACGTFVSELLESAPHVHVIATSRAAFGLRAERCYVVPPLALADAERLFLERARSVGWESGDDTGVRGRVAAMCDRLDRLPLALELAAASLGSLPLADVERQLAEAPDQLRSRDRTTPTRHRSLPDMIAWSVALLEESERDAFVRLAVFAGAFSASAAKGVCDVDAAMLANLVAKSVLARVDAVESRFAFLISIAHYGRRLLDAHPRAASLHDAHAAWYAAIAARSREPGFHKTELVWLGEFEREFPNITKALEWTLARDGFFADGFALAFGVGYFCMRRGFFRDGISWLEPALARAAPGSPEQGVLQALLSRIQCVYGNLESGRNLARAAVGALENGGTDADLALAMCQEVTALTLLGRLGEAEALCERALPIARRSGDPAVEGRVLALLAVAVLESQPARSRDLFLRAIARYTECGNVGGVAEILMVMAGDEYARERYDLANEHLRRALVIHRELGRPDRVAAVLGDLGDSALMQGSLILAHRYYAEALGLLERSEAAPPLLGFVLAGIAGIAFEHGRLRDAAVLLGAAASHEQGYRSAAVVRVRDHVRGLAERALGEETCALEMGFGRALSDAEAMRLGRSVLEHHERGFSDVAGGQKNRRTRTARSATGSSEPR
jgi:predicted ATPase/DNA-binding SARP family transcriptional activator